MKKAALEKFVIVGLFIAVLVTFSFAQRDSKKLDKLYVVATFMKLQLNAISFR